MLRAASLATFLLATTFPPCRADGPAVLRARCASCHNASTRMSGLDLSTRAAALTGGTRGPSLNSAEPSASLLLKAIRREGDLKMPPGNATLPAAEVEEVARWLAAGAPWTSTDAAPEPQWWSFRKPVKPPVPANQHPIDALLAASPTAAANRTLIRRATFDLHGLPPTPAEIDAFLADTRPGAYDRLIDRLLASPRYGERWGRLWLDVVRYADTAGYETDAYFASAWRYRDYVIRSFNAGKPYDVFIKEQIAADEIWPDNLDLNGSYLVPASKLENLERRLGTALYTLGALPVENSFFGDQYRAEWQAEAAETTAAAFLGLSLGCARCHDHKFDPIPQRDFYRLSAMFAGSEDREVPIASQMAIFEYTRHQTRQVIVDHLRDQYKSLRPGDKDARETLLRKIGEAYVKAPEMVPHANLLVHTAPVPATHLLIRGDWQQPGDKVAPGTLSALGPGPDLAEPADGWFIPRRRKALAEWIASRDNPLTARVMVNRIWQGHFGEGLVATPNDFGRQGAPPANPHLLDWLAVEFMDSGWDIKHLHRLIMTSAAYRAARPRPLRVDAETLRDSVLAVSGSLNPAMFGPAIATPLAGDEKDGMRDLSQWPIHPDPAEHARRSVYLFVKRSFRLPMLEAFDAPDTTQSCARREVSTVAPQALTLLNSEWVSAQAAVLADRVKTTADPVTEIWRRAFGRPPAPEEHSQAKQVAARLGLPRLCLLVFNMNEFVYVD